MIGKISGALIALSLISVPAWSQGRPPADAIDLSQAIVYNSPTDVASWPVTTAITQITMRPEGDPTAGLSLVFSGQQTWPDYTPPGWDGPLQYTVWAVVKVGGQWYTSGFIQMWRGRASTGAPLVAEFGRNWAYDGRWGPMQGHQAFGGEQMGFFVTAGNARGEGGVSSVRERSNVVAVSLPANDTGVFTFAATAAFRVTAMDADGDGQSEITVYRPSTGQWLALASSTNYTKWGSLVWGITGDVPVPGDYDGDGLTDLAVYRPSTGSWIIAKSSTKYSTWVTYNWGMPGDIPVPGDYDGDGKTDPAVYRPSTGMWLILKSSTNYQWVTYQWGVTGDVPVPGDYDGDGKTDVAVYRPSTGTWLIIKSSTNFQWVTYQWGAPGDIPIQSDYDGDGKTDVAVYRPSTGVWLILKSSTPFKWVTYQWGVTGDMPVPGDYDGDGKTDVAVYRPSTGTWLVLKSSTNFKWVTYQWGMPGDVPLFVTR